MMMLITCFAQDVFTAVPSSLPARCLEVFALRDGLLHRAEAGGACGLLRTGRKSRDEVGSVERGGKKKVLLLHA